MAPLSGCVVVDASIYLAGPFAGLMLGDLGAEVVKVEPPRGDPMRRFGKRRNGASLIFVNMNRGKARTTIDLKSAEGVAELLGHVARADVLIENWRPGVAERLGLSDETLWAANPRLVHCSVTGFGHDGPRARMPAFDTVIQALSGLAWFHSRSGRPQVLRTYVVDKMTGVFAAQAILAALYQRERTGLGQRVDVDLMGTAAYFNFPDLFAGRTALDDTEVLDAEADLPGANSLLRTTDGWMVVAPTAGEHVARACEAVGHPEWIDELRQIRDTRDLSPLLMSRLDSVTVTGPTAHWLAAFAAADVPAAPVLDLDGHLDDAAELYGRAEDPDVGPIRTVSYPARIRPAGSP